MDLGFRGSVDSEGLSFGVKVREFAQTADPLVHCTVPT